MTRPNSARSRCLPSAHFAQDAKTALGFLLELHMCLTDGAAVGHVVDIMTGEGDGWGSLAEHYAALGAPYVPPPAVVSQIAALSAHLGGAALLLGVTPSFASLPGPLTACDLDPGVVATIWPGDTASHRALVANWQAMPFPDASFRRIFGDGSLNCLAEIDQIALVLAECNRLLEPGGEITMRLFARPEHPESLAALAASRRKMALGEWRWRIASGIAAAPDYRVALPEITQAAAKTFGGLAEFYAAAGFSQREIAFTERTRTLTSAYLVPPRQIFLDQAAKAGFQGRFLETSGYPCAEDFPILHLIR